MTTTTLTSTSSDAPDGGWGFACVAGSFMVHLIVLGIQYSGGVFLSAFLDEWPSADTGTVAWIGSSSIAVMLISSMVTAPLTRTYGCRIICIAGAVVCTTGLLLGSFSTQLWQAALTYGAITGIGFSASFTSSVLIVPQWFSKRRAFAFGIAVAGSGVGTLVVAPLSESLITTLGWRITLRLLAVAAGIIITLAGLTYYSPLTVPAAPSTTAAVSKPSPDQGRTSLLAPSAAADHERHVAGTSDHDDVVEPSTIETARFEPLVKDTPVPATETSFPTVHVTLDVTLKPPPEALQRGSSWPVVLAASAAKQRLAWDRVLEVSAFRVVLVAVMISITGYHSVFSHLVVSAMAAGLQRSQAALGVSVLGGASMAGRILLGRVADSGMIPIHRMWFASLIIGGTVTCLVPVLEPTVAGLCVFGIIFGACAGTFIALMTPMVADAVGVTRLPDAMALVFGVQAPFVLVGPPAAGWIRDGAQTYWPAWLFCGLLMVVGGSLIAIFPTSHLVPRKRDTGPAPADVPASVVR